MTGLSAAYHEAKNPSLPFVHLVLCWFRCIRLTSVFLCRMRFLLLMNTSSRFSCSLLTFWYPSIRCQRSKEKKTVEGLDNPLSFHIFLIRDQNHSLSILPSVGLSLLASLGSCRPFLYHRANFVRSVNAEISVCLFVCLIIEFNWAEGLWNRETL